VSQRNYNNPKSMIRTEYLVKLKSVRI